LKGQNLKGAEAHFGDLHEREKKRNKKREGLQKQRREKAPDRPRQRFIPMEPCTNREKWGGEGMEVKIYPASGNRR